MNADTKAKKKQNKLRFKLRILPEISTLVRFGLNADSEETMNLHRALKYEHQIRKIKAYRSLSSLERTFNNISNTTGKESLAKKYKVDYVDQISECALN